MRRLLALLIVAALAVPAPLAAQAEQTPAVDVTRLGVSLSRIRSELKRIETRESMTHENGRLNVRVEVLGVAPPIDFIPDDFSLTFGPVPNSAPTHREHIAHVTPREFSSPTFPVYGLAVWAAQKIAERSKKARCEEEIAIYRAQVMQGIAVAAPRCTQ